ncbi:MAG: GNAT family N-acetyltransferase [Sphaerochaeta sp.]|nr:GNAT family N-acetyltransferase [Sphaerochaeta sp.]
MEIIQTNRLSAQQIQSIRSLQKLCFGLEGLENEPFLSNELNTDLDLACFYVCFEDHGLVGFLSAFFPTGDEVEINGFVHPELRNRGIFSSLAAAARKTYERHPFHQMLFQVEPSSESGKAYVRSRFPHIHTSEYRLRLSKSRWQEKRPLTTTIGTLVEADGEYRTLFIQTATNLLREEAGFVQRMLGNPERKGYLYLYKDKPTGVLQKCKEGENLTMIYGVAIDEKYRGQGHGKAMFTLALDSFFMSCDSLSLEVDSHNPRAYGLYKALGFEIDFQVDYHSLILS